MVLFLETVEILGGRQGLTGGSRSLEACFLGGYILSLAVFLFLLLGPRGKGLSLPHAPAAILFCLIMGSESTEPGTMD
jgi:hypothetical protein